MGVDVDVRGQEGIALVGRAVRRLGSDRRIVNNMAREIRAAGPPIRAEIRRSALATLPKRGGLNRWVAASRVTVRVRRGASSAGVTVVGGRNSSRGRSDLKRIDAGRVRAPLWGDRRYWHLQSVRPGFFRVSDEGVTAFRDAVVRAVDQAAAEVLRGG